MTDRPDGSSGSSSGKDLSAWMAAYQAGEATAFEKLYRGLAPRLRKYLISLTSSVPRAEDLLQETFLQIHRSRHTYTPPRPVAPWAYGIARHVYLMDVRAWSRRQRLETEQDEACLELSVAPLGEGVADRERVRRAVAGLSPERREPLLLHHVWGFSFKEIAGILGIREGAAKVRAHRARHQLKRLLEELDERPGSPSRNRDPGGSQESSGEEPKRP